MRLFILFAFILLCSCSTRSNYSKKYNISKKVNLAEVPFISQEELQCGPASLAMLMNFRGSTKSADELSAEAFTPGKKGSLQADMISSIRRNRFLALPVNTFKNLLQEVNAGNPVLVLQNLGLSWYPRWHYAVVTGYDLTEEELILHSGTHEDLRLGFFTFNKTWARSGNWGMLVMNPGDIPATSGELDMVRSTARLEAMNFYPEAIRSYESILRKWNDSLGARIGLGNIYYSQKKFQKSAATLREATVRSPDSAEAWHNYALALKSNNQLKEAKIAAKAAIEKCNKESLAVYQQNLSDLIR